MAIHPPAGLEPPGPLELGRHGHRGLPAMLFSPRAAGPACRAPVCGSSKSCGAARVGAGVTLRPARARGLAWLNPASLSAGLRLGRCWPRPPPPRPGRRTGPDGVAEVRCEVMGACLLRVESHTVARVASGRLAPDWRIALAGPGPLPRTLPVGLDGPFAAAPAWRVESPDATPVPARPLNAAERAGLGLPPGGSAWEPDLAGISGAGRGPAGPPGAAPGPGCRRS